MTLTTSSIAAAGLDRSAPRTWLSSALACRALVLAAIGIATIAGLTATDAAVADRAARLDGEGLTRLLRGMAALKAMMAIGVAAGVIWRLGSPVSPARLASYTVACAAMAAGPGLIWNIADLGVGAALLHAGLIAGLVLLWRDPETGRRLSRLVARRNVAGQERRRIP